MAAASHHPRVRPPHRRPKHELWLVCAVLLLICLTVALVLSVARRGSPTHPLHVATTGGRPHAAAPSAHDPTPTAPQLKPMPALEPGPGTERDLPGMLGQMIVARFPGANPSASFLARIRAGQIGGVILFADNVAGGLTATRALTDTLQRAAREGGKPPLLIMTDQEGGTVKRLPGPPSLPPSAMTTTGIAFRQGQATGALLHATGINVDLAPVADVERVAGSFLGTRSFGSTPSLVAQHACAFAAGLASEHVAYTLKHFPGLGRASGNTDAGPASIDAPADVLRSDYQAYRTCAANPLALVMISSAAYPALSGSLPAVMAPATYQRELPIANAVSDVTISDDLESPALADQAAPALHAINAGLDLLMYAQTPQRSADSYVKLLADARSRVLSTSRIRAAGEQIAALKRRLETSSAAR